MQTNLLSPFDRITPLHRLPPHPHGPYRHSNHTPLALTGRLLFIQPADPRHLPHILLLSVLPTELRPSTSRSRGDHRDSEYSRAGSIGGTGGLLWHMHKSGRGFIPVFEQCQ